MPDVTFVSQERLAKLVDSAKRECRARRDSLDDAVKQMLELDQQLDSFGPAQLSDGEVSQFDVLAKYIRSLDETSRRANAYLICLEEYKRATESLAECEKLIRHYEGQTSNATYEEAPIDREMGHVECSLYW